VHGASQMLRDFRSCGGADRLQASSALADDDRLLAVAFDQDLLADRRRSVGTILPGLRLDRGCVGELLMKLVDDLFAR